jgi:hypothetical protein
VTQAPRLDLSRPRDVGGLLGDGLQLYLRNFGTFVSIAAAVVIPVQVIVAGVGLEQVTSGYDGSPPLAEVAVPAVVGYVVTAPLVAAMIIHALLSAAEGQAPSAGRSIMAGLDVFTPLFLAVLLAAAGISVGIALLVLPGIYLRVRWYFVAQSVVIDGRRGPDALRRSGELVRGTWWRVFAITLLVELIAALPAALIQQPLAVAAEAADRAVFSLAGSIIAQLVATPFIAIVGTLLYFDLTARRAGTAPPPVPPPPQRP